jgi:hypothetical protein
MRLNPYGPIAMPTRINPTILGICSRLHIIGISKMATSMSDVIANELVIMVYVK